MKRLLNETFLATFVAGALFTATNSRPLHAQAASPTSAEAPQADSSKADRALAQQIAEMQAKAARLQGALAQNTSPAAKNTMGQMPATSPVPGMSPGMSPGGGMGMGMDKMEKSKMAGAPTAPPSAAPMSGGMGMGMMEKGKMGGGTMDMMKMMGMNAMPPSSPGMAPAQSGMPQSALPGFPGVSHLYHIGAAGFFLDHAQHINLSADQQAALSKMKEEALTAKNNADRQIEQADQELGTLTSSDQPENAKIETKVREIEKLRVDQRLRFIRAVGEAATLLTDDQRKILTGAMQPAAASPSSSPAMSPMSGM